MVDFGELNTPLTPIKVQMHLLKARSETAAGEGERHSIQILDRNFQRLSGLVQDLLDSTRLQTNRLTTAPRPMDFAPVLHDAVDSMRPAAEKAKLELQLECPTAIACIADGPRLTQVLNNLLVNALKFTPANGRVKVVAATDGALVRVTVKDTGLGMTAEQQARLFQPFEQVHQSQLASHTGSGLGLYICKGIIESHGGRIWCESAGPGKGSLFGFEIPLAGPPATAPTAA